MAFTEKKEYKLEIIPPYSIIQCREANIVEKDGTEVGRTYHRHIRVPGDDVSGDCAELKAVATALWTTEVVAEYNTTHKKGKKQSPEQAVKSRENAMGNKSRVGQKRPAEETRKVSETLKAKYASGEMIHWTKRPEHAHRFKKELD